MQKKAIIKLWYKIFFGILLFIALWVSFSFSAAKSLLVEKPAFTFISDDSVDIKVNEVLDTNGTVLLYKSRFRTPVCEDKICYDVVLVFYWNLLGDFLKYELIPGKPLTKQNHTPFSDADYLKLSAILSDKQSDLRQFKKEELITKNFDSNVDAVSGATVASIKEQTISGALYSCYTLWHIANGVAADSIKEHTVKMFDRQLVRQIMAMNSQDAYYFLINNFTKVDFAIYLSEIQYLIGRSQGYFAKNCIEKIPDELLSNAELQVFFAEQYEKLDYYGQIALLNRLQNKVVLTELLSSLVANMDNDPLKNDLLVNILGFNAQKVDDKMISHLVGKIVNDSIIINKETLYKISLLAKNRNALRADIRLIKSYYRKNRKK